MTHAPRLKRSPDDVSVYTKPSAKEPPPREWSTHARSPRCRYNHRMNYIGTVDATSSLPGELHIFAGCRVCEQRTGVMTFQFGHMWKQQIEWFALPSQAAWDGFMDLVDLMRRECGSLTTEQFKVLIRQEWNKPNGSSV
jgi:hypothetical protein